MSILRSMETFSYPEFLRLISAEKFSREQKSMLNIRLGILDSCLQGGTSLNCVTSQFREGELTIIEWAISFFVS